MAEEALKLWMSLPADTRRLLLSNVWCVDCRKAVTIVDYHAELKGVAGKNMGSAMKVNVKRQNTPS